MHPTVRGAPPTLPHAVTLRGIDGSKWRKPLVLTRHHRKHTAGGQPRDAKREKTRAFAVERQSGNPKPSIPETVDGEYDDGDKYHDGTNGVDRGTDLCLRVALASGTSEELVAEIRQDQEHHGG